jgi:hypothetical protein
MAQGRKFEVGAVPAASGSKTEPARLPEAYSTGKLLLVARDPNNLYAHWDLTQAQQARYDSLSADQRLVLKVHGEPPAATPASEVSLHPESSHCFVRVDRPGASYTAELGYYNHDRQWVTIVASESAKTPTSGFSQDKSVRFAAMPAERAQPGSAGKDTGAPGLHSEPTIKSPVTASAAALGAIIPPRLSWIPALGIHLPEQGAPSAWAADPVEPAVDVETWPAKTDAMHSEEIADWVLQQAEGEGLENVSSPSGGGESKGFWFKLGAELVIYGATESGATVSLGGLPVAIRPDGTFSCRFPLPDGDYEMEISAVSAEGQSRRVELRIHRSSVYSAGETG